MTGAFIPYSPETKRLLGEMLAQTKSTMKTITVLLLGFAVILMLISLYTESIPTMVVAFFAAFGCLLIWAYWWNVRDRIRREWYLSREIEIADFKRWCARHAK